MSTAPTHASHTASHTSWWGRLAKPDKDSGNASRPVRIDVDEISDHMLRDIGMIDGRAARRERSEADDLGALYKDNPKRFV